MKFITFLEKLCLDTTDVMLKFQYKHWETDFLRFYHSQINYNISKESTSLETTVYKGKKSYSFDISSPNEDKLLQQLELAMAMIDSLPEDPDFVDLEDNKDIAKLSELPNNIQKVNLQEKTTVLEYIANAVKQFDFDIFGTFICNYEQTWQLNSTGLNKYSYSSPIMLELKAVSNKNMVTVLETYGGENWLTFNKEDFCKSLVDKVAVAIQPVVDIEPGDYEVVLSPRCIGEFLSYLSGGMHASTLDQRNSFFEGKVDQQIFPETITLQDDPRNPGMTQCYYNSDGHIYNPMTLIYKGVFQGFVVDNYYSHKTGLTKTGNGGNCLVLEPGDKTLPELIGSIKKGIYISSLHYMNFINYKETSLTGLTRDGTFLIEDGKIVSVVSNLRFTEKISRILENIVALEKDTYVIPFSDNYGEFSIQTVRMPHVKVSKFQITSSTHTI